MMPSLISAACPKLKLFFSERQSATVSSSASHSTQENPFALLKGKRIVIVEDEGITQMQLQSICRSLGLIIAGAAGTAQAGIDLTLHERPELVLMDIKMPGEMSGLDAAEEIVAAYPACVVMLTAFADAESQDRAKRVGACGYIVKPVNRDSLPHYLAKTFGDFQSSSRETH